MTKLSHEYAARLISLSNGKQKKKKKKSPPFCVHSPMLTNVLLSASEFGVQCALSLLPSASEPNAR